jgi:hypothetical protein
MCVIYIPYRPYTNLEQKAFQYSGYVILSVSEE